MSYKETYLNWLNSPALSQAEKAELQAIAGDEKEIESRFQAFAEVILAEGPESARKGVAICFDCRHHSDEFAREAARVMAGNGIPVRIFESLRPTPELSFAIREYGCIAGINVTASHNPKEYNGYKVYWEDGAQLPPRHADAIAQKMAELDLFASPKLADFEQAMAEGRITRMGAETDEAFLAHVMGQVNDQSAVERVADTFKMVYTPFHGTGYRLIPEVLRRLGMKHVLCVPEQMVIDGDFPTVASPNPENPEGFHLAVALADREGADFILGSDPDADRVGLMVRNREGRFVPLSGNQTGVLLLDYLITAKKRAGTLPANAAALKTIVTTEMARKVAEVNGVQMFDTFTGFKFMAEKKNALEQSGEGKVLFSYEESYGYMMGDYVRDKDAVTAALVCTEMAAWYYGQGMTLYDAMMGLYEKYGWYGEKTLNLVMPGLDGLKKMATLMQDLRARPLTEIAGTAVVLRKDYSSGTQTDVAAGTVKEMELKGSNVLKYKLADGTDLVVRPSGTEPKVKVYILAQGASKAVCDATVAKYAAWAETLKR
ncbi:MAG: phospho-sugar mutase [Clostridiales bacterium]|nr:phospho-sugar mutase [Clostridiales bacterium]